MLLDHHSTIWDLCSSTQLGQHPMYICKDEMREPKFHCFHDQQSLWGINLTHDGVSKFLWKLITPLTFNIRYRLYKIIFIQIFPLTYLISSPGCIGCKYPLKLLILLGIITDHAGRNKKAFVPSPPNAFFPKLFINVSELQGVLVSLGTQGCF